MFRSNEVEAVSSDLFTQIFRVIAVVITKMIHKHGNTFSNAIVDSFERAILQRTDAPLLDKVKTTVAWKHTLLTETGHSRC